MADLSHHLAYVGDLFADGASSCGQGRAMSMGLANFCMTDNLKTWRPSMNAV